MKLIFAQGNPGAEYAKTRHNVGFWLLDHYAAARGVTFASKPKFNADIAEYTVNNEKILLVKPMTFYNETGVSARALIDFYKVTPADVLVIHDDLALPLGTIRTREQGSDAGNNGIKSFNQHIGPLYKRIRVGIWTEAATQRDAAAYVLGKFTADEQRVLEDVQPIIANCIDRFINGQFEVTSHRS